VFNAPLTDLPSIHIQRALGSFVQPATIVSEVETHGDLALGKSLVCRYRVYLVSQPVISVFELAILDVLPWWLEDAENGLADAFRTLLAGLTEDLRSLDNCITDLDEQIAQSVKENPVAQRLLELGVLALSLPVFLLVLLAMGLCSTKDENLLRLSGSPHVNIVREAKSGYLASVNGVTVT